MDAGIHVLLQPFYLLMNIAVFVVPLRPFDTVVVPTYIYIAALWLLHVPRILALATGMDSTMEPGRSDLWIAGLHVHAYTYMNTGMLDFCFKLSKLSQKLCLTLHQQQGTFYFQIPLTFGPLSATGISWEDGKEDLYCVAIAMCFITTAHWKNNHHFFWCIPLFLNS